MLKYTVANPDRMTTVREKLDTFLETNKVPHIIFHGESGTGKRTIVREFINQIYHGNRDLIACMTMNVNCAHGKGIKFVREELSLFTKMNIDNSSGLFKTVVLSNADELTIDAQSALRRCIELYSHHTRFFVIVENRFKLLRPILSRFCEIYVSGGEHVNTGILTSTSKNAWLRKYLAKQQFDNETDALKISLTLYEKGYSGIDIMKWLECDYHEIDDLKKYELLLAFQKAKAEFRNEKIFIMFILTFIFLRSDINLESMDGM